MPLCGGCGATSPAGARYCQFCGTRLADESGPARRIVTVLFTDISGFTGIAEGLDAETLRRLMSRFYEAMRAVVEGVGGTAARFIGDAVMAVFGIPQLHEDDALRAVHAALDMREEVARLNAEFRRECGVEIQVCTGINTGEVATDESSLADALVVGDVVNVAARLQSVARPGDILLGTTTSRLVRHAADIEELEPLALKGRGATVTASRLLGIRGHGPRRSRRPTQALVGRDKELAVLAQAFAAAVDERTCRLAMVVGPAGIGKTELVSEFAHELTGRATILSGFCQPYGQQSPLAPVADIIRQGTGLAVGDDVDACRSELLALLGDTDDREVVAEHVLFALGLTRGGSGPDETAWGIRKVLEVLAHRLPLVVVVDDLHWASPTLLGVVQHVRDWSRDVPILLVCLTRPELLNSEAWVDEPSRSVTVALQPLTHDDGSRLVQSLLHGDPVAPKALAAMTSVAEGNPLYLQEILSMLLEEGALRCQDGRWNLAHDSPAVTAPLPIQTLLAVRLERLSREHRTILETASVIGTTFSLEDLRSHLPDELRPRTEEGLRWLADHDFVAERGQGELQFRHVLVRDAAYNGMSKKTRARVHEAHARRLESSPDGLAEADKDAVIGHHLEQAYRHLADLGPVDEHAVQLARGAGKRLSSSGCRLFESGDMPVAATVLSRAVSLLPPEDSLSLSLLPNLAEALMSTGELSRACDVAEQALERAQKLEQRVPEARAVLVRSTGRLFTDPEGGEEALGDVRTVLPVMEEEGDESGLAKAWHLLSMAEIAQSHFAAAEEAMERAALHARRGGDRRQELDILSWLPLPIWIGPRSADESIRRYEDILARADGDPKVGAMVTVMLGAQQAMIGQFEQACRSVGEARAALEDLGLRFLIAGTSQVAGWVDLLAGDLAGAERELSSGYSALEQMGETGLLSTVAGLWAQALYGLGDHEGAARKAELGESIAGPGDLFSLVLARAVRAKVLARSGRVQEAERLAREAVDLAMRTDSPQLIGDALMDHSVVVSEAGSFTEAAEMVSQAMRHFERKGNVVALASARRAYDSLGG